MVELSGRYYQVTDLYFFALFMVLEAIAAIVLISAALKRWL
jgi:hypothetical protein